MPLEVKPTAAGQPGVTLDEDTYNRLPDGREELVGRKGQTIPYAVAQRYGLVQAGPEQTPEAIKAAREAADRAVPTPTLDALGQSPGSPEPEVVAPDLFTRPAEEDAPAAAGRRPSKPTERHRAAAPKPEGEGK